MIPKTAGNPGGVTCSALAQGQQPHLPGRPVRLQPGLVYPRGSHHRRRQVCRRKIRQPPHLPAEHPVQDALESPDARHPPVRHRHRLGHQADQVYPQHLPPGGDVSPEVRRSRLRRIKQAPAAAGAGKAKSGACPQGIPAFACPKRPTSVLPGRSNRFPEFWPRHRTWRPRRHTSLQHSRALRFGRERRRICRC